MFFFNKLTEVEGDRISIPHHLESYVLKCIQEKCKINTKWNYANNVPKPTFGYKLEKKETKTKTSLYIAEIKPIMIGL